MNMAKKNQAKEKGSAIKILIILFVLFITAVPAYVVLMGEERPQAAPPPQQLEKPKDFEIFYNMPHTHEQGKARMTIFFDFYCPACFRFYLYTFDLKERYGDKIEITHIGYPIFGEKSWLPLEAYELAKEQGMGGAMENLLFVSYHQERKNISDPALLLEFAKNLNLNVTKFEADLKSRRMKGRIEENVALGDKYALDRTPTVIIDGQIKIVNLTLANVEKTVADAIGN